MKPFFAANGVTIYQGDSRELLRGLPDESVHCVVTSPPYWGLRDYGTGLWAGGDSACKHEGDERWYTENTAASASAEAFSQAGEANAERLKKGRWREAGTCKCGAVRVDRQIGLEKTPYEYISTMRMLFAEVRRVLRADGTLWLNMGDSYATGAGSGRSMGGDCFGKQNKVIDEASYPQCQPNRMKIDGLKAKDLCGIPWMLAFALREDGWYLRQDIIWAKPNPMPESVTDRCTKAHEYIFLLSKSERYYYNADAIAEPFADDRNGNPGKYTRTSAASKGANNDRQDMGFLQNGAGWNTDGSANGRNKRDVWFVNSQPFPEAHFATFPEDLIKPCILAGCPEGGTVLDPFGGAGTTGLVARKLHSKAILLELNAEYCEISARRLSQEVFNFEAVPGESGRNPVDGHASDAS